MEGLITRRLLRNVSVVDLVRRSFTVTPRLFLLLLPILGPAFLGVAYVGVTVGFIARRDADAATALVAGLTLAFAGLVAPAVASWVSVAAIRASLGERVRFSLLVEGIKRGGLGGTFGGLLLGAVSLVGYGLCFFPGLVLLAFVLPVTVLGAVERKGFGEALGRGVDLTRGARLRLFGSLFLLLFFSGIALRLSDIAAPRNIYANEDSTHLWLYAVAVSAAAMFSTVWQGALAALAYNDLRIGAEGLEIDGVAREVGGRAVVGLDLGVEAVSENALVLRQRARRTIVVMVASGLGLLVTALVFYPIAKGKLTEYERERAYEKAEEERRLAAEAWAREHPPEAREPRDEPPPALVDDAPLPPRPLPPPPPPSKPQEEILAALKSNDVAERRRALAEDVAPISSELWGTGLVALLKQPNKTDDAQLDLAIIPAISRPLAAFGCSDALNAAREAAPDKAAAVLAKGCPAAPEPRAIDPKSMKGVPLWAAALAITIEIRAKDFDKQKDPLHKAVKAALLKEKLAP